MMEFFENPEMIAAVLNNIGFIILAIISIKQRAKLFLNWATDAKKNEELDTLKTELSEKDYELEIISSTNQTILTTLNLIVQSSKMTAQDKEKVMDMAAKNKQRMQELIDKKKERMEAIHQEMKDKKEQGEEIISTISDFGESVIDKYTQEQ